MKPYLAIASVFCLGLLAAFALSAHALTIYPPAALLQPGDVATTTIRDYAVSPTKIASGLDFTFHGASITNATTTNATTTNFAVTQATTTLNSVAYGWPAADGTNGQALTTNGAGALSWTTPSASAITTSLTAGEPLNAKDAVWIASTTATSTQLLVAQGLSAEGWGLSTANKRKLAQSFSANDVATVDTIQIVLNKGGAPTDNVVIDLETDSAGTPSGTSLATASVTGTTLTTSLATTTFPLSAQVALASGATYWIVMSRSGALDNTNFYGTGVDATQPYARGDTSALNDSSVWVAKSEDSGVSFQLKLTAGRAYRAGAEATYVAGNFAGIAQAAATTGAAVTTTVSGIVSGLSGLTPGVGYFLSNTMGDISTTAGVNSRKVCLALTTTNCVLSTNF